MSKLANMGRYLISGTLLLATVGAFGSGLWITGLVLAGLGLYFLPVLRKRIGFQPSLKLSAGVTAGALVAFIVAAALDDVETANEDQGGVPEQAVARSDTSIPTPAREGRRDEQGNIVADTFDVEVSLGTGDLTVRLHTDLPDRTQVMVSVDRIYKTDQDDEDYVGSYFSDDGTVSSWRTGRVIPLDDDAWRAEIEDTRRIMAAAGDPFTIRSISDNVRIDATVPVNQANLFREGNSNLIGNAVEDSPVGRIVSRTEEVRLPLEGEYVQTRWADPRSLESGKRYRISRATPLVPDPSPRDPLEALAQIVQLPPGTVFRVIRREDRAGLIWYEVRAMHEGERAGWINSTALVGQELVEVD